MGKRRAHGPVYAEALPTVGRMLLTLKGLRGGIACVEEALDECQRALNEVLLRIDSPGPRDAGHAAEAEPRGLGCDGNAMSEEDWLMWDSCSARIDATVETCRNLGYSAGRGPDGSWRVRFGL